MTRSRTRRAAFAVCATVLLLAACRHTGAAPPTRDGQEAEIYHAVLARAESRLVVRTTSAPPEFVGDAMERIRMHRNELSGLNTSTVQSFLERNRVSVQLPELGDARVEMVSKEEWSAHLDGRERRWNRGVMMLSRIGYSSDGTQALVYVVKACPLCGGADYVLLTRTGDRWMVTATANDWNS
jgi:hypothetical protein